MSRSGARWHAFCCDTELNFFHFFTFADVRGVYNRGMMTTKEAAQQIRKALKSELGLNSRKVSVRADSYSMGSSIRINVKDPLVELEAVEKIARSFESVRYCEASQEILSGGNRFIFVQYASNLFAAECDMVRAWIPAVRAGATVSDENFRLYYSRGTYFAEKDGELLESDLHEFAVIRALGLEIARRAARKASAEA